MKSINTYEIKGIIRHDFPIDLNTRITAYSEKQALLKLTFVVLQDNRIKINSKQLYNTIKKSRLSIKKIS